MRKFATFAVPVALLAAVIGFALVAFGGESAEAQGRPADLQSNLVVVLRGTATGYDGAVLGLAGLTCFDVDLVDPRTDRVIGTATDCLDTARMDLIGDDGGFAISNTTIFNFTATAPSGEGNRDSNRVTPRGTVASLSRTTVQPVEGDPTTFITGEVASEDNIIRAMGTGDFAGATGSTRLSGILDLSEFGSGIVTFDCIFVIHLN